ncbi:MAG: HAD family hydrolase [Candidatus Micrarchaeota archaeon]
MAYLPKKLKGIKAVFFDLDGTLYTYRGEAPQVKSELNALQFFSKKYKLSIFEAHSQYIRAKKAYVKSQSGTPASGDREKWFLALLNSCGIRDAKLAKQMRALYWKTLLREIAPYADFKLIYPRIKQKYITGVISDGIRKFQLPRLNKVGCKFDYILFSSDVGVEKPNEKIYLYALKLAKVKPHEAVYIGDRPWRDVKGAKQLGIHTIWLRRGYIPPYDCPLPKDCEPEFTIESFLELGALLL